MKNLENFPEDNLNNSKVLEIPNLIRVNFPDDRFVISPMKETGVYRVRSEIPYLAVELDNRGKPTGRREERLDDLGILINLNNVSFQYLDDEEEVKGDNSTFNNALVTILFMRHYNSFISGIDKILEYNKPLPFKIKRSIPKFTVSIKGDITQIVFDGENDNTYDLISKEKNNWELAVEDAKDLEKLGIERRANILKALFRDMYEGLKGWDF
jgi:hypothetical protein